MTMAMLNGLIAQFCIGSAVLSLVSFSALQTVSRTTKAAVILFSGLAVPGLLILLLLCVGFPFDPQWFYALGALGAVITIFRRREFLCHWQKGGLSFSGNPPFPAALTVGFVFLALWTTISALCLPSVDYDSIAIWGYRVRVLLNEGTLYTESLRDPYRIAPMPKHPYLLPVLEAAFCGRAGFSHAAQHIPHLGLYLAFVLLVIGAAREWFVGEFQVLFLAAMLLMPAPAVQWWLEGAREPAIGVAALWSTYWFLRWLRHPSSSAAAFVGLALGAMYHIKVEGAAFAAGSLVAVFIVSLMSGADRRIRLLHFACLACALLFLVIPWTISKALMLPTTQDYDFTAGFAEGWSRRLSMIPFVAWMGLSEMFLRPELYGLAPHLGIIWLVRGITRRTWRAALPAVFPALLCLLGILAIYVVRQEQLGAARNVTFSRRFVCVMPSLVLVAAYAYYQARISLSDKKGAA